MHTMIFTIKLSHSLEEYFTQETRWERIWEMYASGARPWKQTEKRRNEHRGWSLNDSIEFSMTSAAWPLTIPQQDLAGQNLGCNQVSFEYTWLVHKILMYRDPVKATCPAMIHFVLGFAYQHHSGKRKKALY